MSKAPYAWPGWPVFIVFILIGFFVTALRDDDSQKWTVIKVSVGDDVVLKWPEDSIGLFEKLSESTTYVATNNAAWDAMWEAIHADDYARLDRLVESGQVPLVRYGTRARILVVESVRHKVRLMDGPSAGVTGWVYMQEVQR